MLTALSKGFFQATRAAMNPQLFLILLVVTAVTSTADAAANAEPDKSLNKVGDLGDSIKLSSSDRRRPIDSTDAVSFFPLFAVLLAVIRAMDHSLVDHTLKAVLEWVAPSKPVTDLSCTAAPGTNDIADSATMCHVNHGERIWSPDTSRSMTLQNSTSRESMPRIDEECNDEMSDEELLDVVKIETHNLLKTCDLEDDRRNLIIPNSVAGYLWVDTENRIRGVLGQ